MNYSRYFIDNELEATKNGTREIVSYREVLDFAGQTQDDVAELLMDILNGVYDVNDCIKDIKEYGRQ
jgi:hypothetical protein